MFSVTSSMALLASLAILPRFSMQANSVGFCKEGTCADCPALRTDLGPGYPLCVIFKTDELFVDKDYPAADGG